jgi:hypothetical protein
MEFLRRLKEQQPLSPAEFNELFIASELIKEGSGNLGAVKWQQLLRTTDGKPIIRQLYFAASGRLQDVRVLLDAQSKQCQIYHVDASPSDEPPLAVVYPGTPQEYKEYSRIAADFAE